MFNKTGISRVSAGAPIQILFNVQNQMSVSGLVAQELGVTEGSKKIVKAGTPVTGDLTDRSTAFTAAGEGNAIGVVLHDVDVTEGEGNASILLWGFVNLDRIDDTTAAKITSGVKTALKGSIWFLKDN